MSKPDYNSMYVTLKKEHFDLLVNEFLVFEERYESKKKAIDDYNTKVKPNGHGYKDFIYYDDFGHKTPRNDTFKWEIVKEMNDSRGLKNWVSVMIEERLPKILVEFKKKKEDDIKAGWSCNFFDHKYFDSFNETEAVKLIANIDAFGEFQKYLDSILNSDGKIETETENNDIINRNPIRNSVEPIFLNVNESELFIKELYELLTEVHKLIEIEYSDFLKHFSHCDNLNMIIWKGTEAEITYLFHFLKLKNKHIYMLITKHFLNNKGGSFKNKQLSSAYNNSSSTPRIDTVIEDLKKIKNQ